jgi:CubicO group peptidase (beta-lactamase class C family)
MRSVVATFCLSALLAGGLIRAQEGDLNAKLNATLAAAVEKSHVPGMAAVIVRSKGIVAAGVAGVRKNGSSDRIQPDDRFHLGSNTKAMTATLIARFVERGKLSWSTRPVDVFRDMQETIDPELAGITLADLLNHRAGIAGFTDGGSPDFPEALKVAGSGTPAEQRSKFTDWLLRRKPEVPPRTKMLYSNAGYAVAATMLEKAAGKSWEELIEAELWEPLKIRSGGFGWPARGTQVNQPWGHVRKGNEYAPHDPNGSYQLVDFLAPAGAVRMSVPDYARFLQMHLQGLAGKDTILKAETVRALHTPVGEYGFGWGVRTLNGIETQTHNGSAGTFWLHMRMWLSLDLAVAVAVNAADKDAGVAANEVAEALRKYAEAQ